MARHWGLVLGVALVSAAFGACGGAVESDAAHAGNDAGGVDGGVDADGAAEVGDGTADVEDASDSGDGDADVVVQSCAACSVLEYTCGQPPMESITLLVSDVEASGCVATGVSGPATWELHCEPLEVCYATTCYSIAEDADGVLTWTPPGSPQITCWPVKK